MGESVSKLAVIIIGPPGSGKDTQALRLEEKYGFVQVPSSKIIRAKFAENPSDPVIQQEKERFDMGLLNTPKLVAEWVIEFVRPLAERGSGLVFSGSPRTPHEADVEFPELVRLYGDRNVLVIHLELNEEEARKRIAGRRFCAANKHPIPDTPEFAGVVTCPDDGSPLERRPLDDADKQITRFKEYRELTEPVLDIAKKYGIWIFPVDGRKTIEAIHHDIVEIIERHRLPVLEE